MGRPAAPADLRADEPDEHPADSATQDRKSVQSPRPRTRPRRRATTPPRRAMTATSTRVEPALRAAHAAQPGPHRLVIDPRASPSGLARRTVWTLQLVLGERVAERPRALGALRPRAAGSGWPTVSPGARPARPGRTIAAAASRVTTTDATPRAAERGERADPGRVQRGRDDDRGHPAPEPARRVATSVSTSGVGRRRPRRRPGAA